MYTNLIKLAKSKKEETQSKRDEFQETKERASREWGKSALSTLLGGNGKTKTRQYLVNKLDSNMGEDVNKVNAVLDKLKEHSTSVDKSPTAPDVVSTYNLPNNKKITILPDIIGKGDSSAHRGRAIYNDPGTNQAARNALHHVNTEPHKRSHIIFRASNSPSALLHEIGHLTGRERNDTLKHKLINANADLYQKSLNYGMGNKSLLAANLLPTIAFGTKRKDGESEEQFMDRRQKNRHLLNAASAIPTLPALAEEARASINAYKLGKKIGVPIDKKFLATAFGTYASSLTPNAVRAVADIADHRLEKNKLKNNKGLKQS